MLSKTKTDLSESSFGFAYAFELITLWGKNVIESAYFPSLAREGMPGGGYDLSLDTTRMSSKGFIYLAQFKRSRYIVGPRANEAREGYPLNYYRFPIRDTQHKQLLKLEQIPNALVEYVAPRFTTHNELSYYFRQGDIRSNVVRAIPSSIGKIPNDRKTHHVVCDEWGNNKKRYSESVEIEDPSDWGAITENGFERRALHEEPMVVEEPTPTERPTIRDQMEIFTFKALSIMEDDIGKGLVKLPEGVSDVRRYLRGFGHDPVGTAQRVARILFGADLIVFSEEDST